jgi:spermidine synthase
VSGGDARVFAQVLGAYLAGIAVGSFASGRVCRTLAAGDTPKYLRLGALFVMGANIVAFLIVPVVARTVQFWDHAATLPLVAVGAALLGAVLPLVTHIAVGPGERAGAHLSYLYLANIVGSAAGSYVTGSIALDHWPLARIAVALAICGVALGGTMLMATSDTQPGRKRAAVVSLVIAGALVLSVGPLFNDLYERLQLKRGYASFRRFAQIIESKAGVITVSDDGTVYGGGVLDGRFNVGLADDTNWVVRAYALSAVHPAPRDVLMIGLGSGSWAQVVAHNPVLDRLTIAEINRGYLQLLATSPDVRSLLINPKVTVAVADGRRWLRSHADRKFDFVVMNTTWNWRAHASNVLSREFFELVRSRLKPGGIVLYNTTWSREAQATGLSVFPYGLRMINCLFLSDTPITFDRARWKQILASYRIDGRAVFDLSQDSDRQLLDAVVAFDNLEDGESVRRAAVGARVITDDNMGTEWNLGSRQGQ